MLTDRKETQALREKYSRLTGQNRTNALRLALLATVLSVVAAGSALIAQPTPPMTLASATLDFPEGGAASKPPSVTEERADLGKVPLAFVPNAGQAASSVRYVAHQRRATMSFAPSELVLTLSEPGSARGTDNSLLGARMESAIADPQAGEPTPTSSTEGRSTGSRSTLRIQFADANPEAVIQTGPTLPGTVNYLLGDDPSRWVKNATTFSAITYTELYPGVNLAFSGDAQHLKAAYTLGAEADLSGVRLALEGGRATLNPAGDLQVEAS